MDASWVRCAEHVQPGGPEHDGGIMSHSWPGNTHDELQEMARERKVSLSLIRLLPYNLDKNG